ncbi:Cna B-type domain-containing protein [Bacillus nitratireducens]|uniref:Cna B-type domain-containing protein n=1 Tax=Bacillus nitratireducens TaxID=2026193 RepID=UPI003AB6EF2B
MSAADEWKYAFTDLAAYDAEGNAYKYEVKEQPVNMTSRIQKIQIQIQKIQI